MSYVLVDMWTKFATFGNPTPPDFENFVDWLPLERIRKSANKKGIATNEDLKYLDISGCFSAGIELEMKIGFKRDRMRFFEGLNLTESFPNVQ